MEVYNGSIDGSNGIILINQGEMKFEILQAKDSGFYANEPLHEMLAFKDNTFLVSSENALYSFTLNTTNE